MTARNAPCPCGSGKKFKHCHGQPRTPAGGQDNAARSAFAKGRWTEAIERAEQEPASEERSRILALALIARRSEGDLERARTALRDWCVRAPRDPEPWRRLLEVALHTGKLEEAGEALAEFAARHRDAADPHYYRGILAQRRGDFDGALQAFGHAVETRCEEQQLPPLDPEAVAVAAAMQACEVAAGNYPGSAGAADDGLLDCPEAADRLATALLQWERLATQRGQAPDARIRAMHADGWYNLGCAAMAGFAAHARAIECFERAVALDPDHQLARLSIPFALNYSESASPDDIFDAHRSAGRWLHRRTPPEETPGEHDPEIGRRLRVGYLSADLRQHSVAHFILPVLSRHDSARFEIFAYHNHPQEDACTSRAEAACAVFRRVAGLSDSELLRRIRDDRIDILVDLNGLTRRHRMAVLARRAAPVQMTWIGYPNTTGLETVDYRLVDAVTDPAGEADRRATERLLRLPSVFSVYEPPENAPDPGPLPCLENGYVTFGSFNGMPKLNPPLLRAFAALLDRVPRSRLLIKNLALRYAAPRRQIRELLTGFGIADERILLAGPTDGQFEHLEHYRRVDIALDSFPYNGTTTTCESLYMGVPVVARAGNDHRSRVAASQIGAAGLETFVASDENSWLDIASALAGDTDRLARLRQGLRARLLSSPLTDAQTFTRNLEHALRSAWAQWCHDEGTG